MTVKLTKDQEKIIVEDYLAGKSSNTLAREYNLTPEGIQKTLHRNGVVMRKGGPPRKVIPNVDEEIIRLAKEGVTLKYIRQRVCKRSSYVAQVLADAGMFQLLKRGANSTAKQKIHGAIGQQVISLFEQGWTFEQLGERYGCTATTISKYLKRKGKHRTRRKVSPYRTNPEFITTVKELWDQNNSCQKIANILGTGTNPVIRALQDLGIRTSRPRREAHPMWKGGRTEREGYILVRLDPDHPFASMRIVTGYVPEHRLVMAQYLGRSLLSTETVHHINGNRSDNRIENLQLRIGQHGSAQCYCCADCGSTRLNPIPLADPPSEE